MTAVVRVLSFPLWEVKHCYWITGGTKPSYVASRVLFFFYRNLFPACLCVCVWPAHHLSSQGYICRRWPTCICTCSFEILPSRNHNIISNRANLGGFSKHSCPLGRSQSLNCWFMLIIWWLNIIHRCTHIKDIAVLYFSPHAFRLQVLGACNRTYAYMYMQCHYAIVT